MNLKAHISIWVLNTQGNIRKTTHVSTCYSGSPRRRGGKNNCCLPCTGGRCYFSRKTGCKKRNVENYIKRLQKLEEIASSFDGVESTFAIQAGREVRVMVKPEIVNDERMIPLARDICKKIEEELEYPGQIKVNIIRESRASDFAK